MVWEDVLKPPPSKLSFGKISPAECHRLRKPVPPKMFFRPHHCTSVYIDRSDQCFSLQALTTRGDSRVANRQPTAALKAPRLSQIPESGCYCKHCTQLNRSICQGVCVCVSVFIVGTTADTHTLSQDKQLAGRPVLTKHCRRILQVLEKHTHTLPGCVVAPFMVIVNMENSF